MFYEFIYEFGCTKVPDVYINCQGENHQIMADTLSFENYYSGGPMSPRLLPSLCRRRIYLKRFLSLFQVKTNCRSRYCDEFITAPAVVFLKR